MVKLAHDGCLAQKVPPLPLRVAGFEGLDGHGHVPLPRHLQMPVADFPGLSCEPRWGRQGVGGGTFLPSPQTLHSPSPTHLSVWPCRASWFPRPSALGVPPLGTPCDVPTLTIPEAHRSQ